MTHAPDDHVARLDERIERRLVEMERLLGSVAHRLGGVMLPTLRPDPDRAEDRAWTRLMFQAESMKDHIVREKHALDFVRGRTRGELESLPAAEWSQGIRDVLIGLMAHGSRAEISLESDMPVGLLLNRALTTLVVALDEQHPGVVAERIEARVEGGVIGVTVSIGSGSAVPVLTPSLVAAWSVACDATPQATLEASATEIRLGGTYRGEA